jgi:hypothetical protein
MVVYDDGDDGDLVAIDGEGEKDIEKNKKWVQFRGNNALNNIW